MASTLLLDTDAWDLVLDVNGNIAVATEPYSLAQDAASAIKTFAGEVFWDNTIGVPYLSQIFGKAPSLSQIKQLFVDAALTVPDVASAQCFLASATGRNISGQIQVKSKTGQVSAASFNVINPQGTG